MRLTVVFLLLLFAGSINKPEPGAENFGFEKGRTQSNTHNSGQNPSQARIAARAEEQPNTQAQQANSYDPPQDALYRWYLRATIAGVVVALGGLWILRNQNRNLANQIKVQSLALRQWVDTTNWRTRLPYPVRPRTLELIVDIVNPTNAPISLILIRITVSDGKTNATGFPRNTLLLPNKPLTYRAYIELGQEQFANLISENGLILQVEGSIIYIDSLKDEWEQRLRLMLACHRGSADGPAAEAIASDYTHTLHEVTRPYDPDFPQPLWRKVLNWYITQIKAM